MILNTRIINDIQYIIDNVYNNTDFEYFIKHIISNIKRNACMMRFIKKHVLNQNIILTVLRNV